MKKIFKRLLLLIIVFSIVPLISLVKAKTPYFIVLLDQKLEREPLSLEFIKEVDNGFLYLYNGTQKINFPYKIIRQVREDSKGYHKLSDVIEKLFFYNEKYKEITELKIIGKTFENRDIYALKISKGLEEDKPTILIVGCHHAREWMSVEIPMKIIEYLLENYEKDEMVRGWIENYEIWIIPILNPDGFEYSIKNDRMWRKNRILNFDNSRGVDNNRNYGYMWGLSVGSSSIPSSETYRGKAPFSEFENQAIRDIVYENPPAIALSYHSFSELILYPWGYTTEQPQDKELLEKIAIEMAKTTGPPNDSDYPGPYDYYPMQSSFLYPTSGDLTDFLYGEMGTLSYTIELNSVQEFFDPPPELIEPTWEQTKGIFFVAMNYVDKIGLLKLNITDIDGSPYEGDILILEKNLTRKTQKKGYFVYFLEEGEYTIYIKERKYKLIIENGKTNEFSVNLGDMSIDNKINDITPPEVKILIPDIFKTTSDRITLKGNLNEMSKISINNVYIGTFDSGDFEIVYPLEKELNILNIEIEDLAKNKTKIIKTIYKVEKKTIELFVGNKKFVINGIEKEIDISPFILNGRTYVPIRFIVEAFGGNINYNEKDKSILFTLHDKSVLMFIDKKNYFINFKEYFMDSPPMLIKPGRVMVPIRFIAEAIDSKVLWDEKSKKITIIYPKED